MIVACPNVRKTDCSEHGLEVCMRCPINFVAGLFQLLPYMCRMRDTRLSTRSSKHMLGVDFAFKAPSS